MIAQHVNRHTHVRCGDNIVDGAAVRAFRGGAFANDDEPRDGRWLVFVNIGHLRIGPRVELQLSSRAVVDDFGTLVLVEPLQ